MARSLIEQWFPASAIGAESLRERGASSALPPINFLHVWWARRPLTASRAAIVASLLPAWPTIEEAAGDRELHRIRDALAAEFPRGEDEYHDWVLNAVGVLGDPVLGRARIRDANEKGIRLQGNGYGYSRAFTTSPSSETLSRIRWLARLRAVTSDPPVVFDPFAGGGSIPLEAARFGCATVANELNPVAVAILNGTVVLPTQLGPEFVKVIRRWGEDWGRRVRVELEGYFPRLENEPSIVAYIWAHTVPCPVTGRPTPLVPNFWLVRSGDEGVALRLDADASTGEVELRVVEGADASEWGDKSTYRQGTAVSVWDSQITFSGDYIREQAAKGEMAEMLLAVATTRPDGRGRRFRAPSSLDLSACQAARDEMARRRARLEIEDLIPSEPIGVSNYDRGHRMYGITQWSDFFTSRQLLSLATALDCLHRVVADARQEMDTAHAAALELYLALALDKAVDYNSRQTSWESDRVKIAHTFEKHNFAFKWSFAEFDAANALIPWAVDQIADAYLGISKLAHRPQSILADEPAPPMRVLLGSASNVDLPDRSVDAVVTDPPYYDNVMYSECADYFYVWLKRSLKQSWPELCHGVLTDKDNEAVANAALFRDVATHSGRRRRAAGTSTASELADARYETLLRLSFEEAFRVLKDDGVMTVMFTHKRVDAWDTLGAALLEAGFEISSSWPVHTESETSLHQAKKNSASSTILLGCRKRLSAEPAYWSDIRSNVETAAEDAAKRFSAQGIKGVDLTLATYGPALSVLSRNWPVYTGNLTADGEREKLRPDYALDLARHRVALLKKRELLGGRDVEFDRATDWWLLAWNDFQAAQFPAGEALKLCIAMDLDLDDVSKQHKLVKAASGDVTLLTPAQRRTAKSLDPDAGTWAILIDDLHSLMLTHDEEGLTASRAWLNRTGKGDDERFSAVLEAAVHAVPRTRDKGGDFTRPEARILESLRATLFDWIEPPTEPELGEVLTLDFDAG